jgi:hypothetical protein
MGVAGEVGVGGFDEIEDPIELPFEKMIGTGEIYAVRGVPRVKKVGVLKGWILAGEIWPADSQIGIWNSHLGTLQVVSLFSG